MSATALLLERYYAPAGGGVSTCASATGAELAARTAGATTTNFSPNEDRLGFVIDVSEIDEIEGLCWQLSRNGVPAASFRAGICEVVEPDVDDAELQADPPDGESALLDLSAISTASAGAHYWFPFAAAVDVSGWSRAYIFLERDGGAFDGSNFVQLHIDTTGGGGNYYSLELDGDVNPASNFHPGYKVYGTADVTAPVLSSPTGAGTSPTAANGTVSSDEARGTLYWIVDQSATPPSVAQIQAGNDSGGAAADASGNQAVSTSGAQNVGTSGLAPSTTYYFYFQQADPTGNDSAVASSASFTTDAAGAAVFPTPYIHEAGPSRGRMLPYQQGGRHPTRG